MVITRNAVLNDRLNIFKRKLGLGLLVDNELIEKREREYFMTRILIVCNRLIRKKGNMKRNGKDDEYYQSAKDLGFQYIRGKNY